MTFNNHSSIQISIIIPVYNEQENLNELYSRLTKVLANRYSYELIFIDDGSTDGSDAVLEKIAQNDVLCKVIYLKRNHGQTPAIVAGFDHSIGNIIVPIDADLQNPPEEIPKLINKINEGYDVCSGWRRYRKDHFFRRKIPSFIANSIISYISNVKLHDYGCTLKAYKRSILENVLLYGEMHRFIPIYASWSGAKITEVEVKHAARTQGQSKYGMERIFKVTLDILVVKFLGDFSSKPIYIFGGFGLITFFLAFLTFMLMVFYKFSGQKDFIETPLPLLGTLFLLIGFISILMGLIAEILVRTYHESQNKPIYLIKKSDNIDHLSKKSSIS